MKYNIFGKKRKPRAARPDTRKPQNSTYWSICYKNELRANGGNEKKARASADKYFALIKRMESRRIPQASFVNVY